MRPLLCLAASLALLSCSTYEANRVVPRSTAADSSLQAVVDRIAAAHPEVARLSIHAVPAGETGMRIVASTVAGRIGEPSDPEDLDAIRSGQPVVMQEAHNLDYTLAVEGPSGESMVVGVTISGASGEGREALLDKAQRVAEKTAAALRATR
jgi:hypothetical protein